MKDLHSKKGSTSYLLPGHYLTLDISPLNKQKYPALFRPHRKKDLKSANEMSNPTFLLKGKYRKGIG